MAFSRRPVKRPRPCKQHATRTRRALFPGQIFRSLQSLAWAWGFAAQVYLKERKNGLRLGVGTNSMQATETIIAPHWSLAWLTRTDARHKERKKSGRL